MSKTTNRFSPEVRERAVRLVCDNAGQHGSCWQAIVLIGAKIGCFAHTLNAWVEKAEVDSGKRAGIPTEMADRMKALERENRELRQGEEDQKTVRRTVFLTNEILRKASAYFSMIEGNAARLQQCRRCSTARLRDGGFHRRASGCAWGGAMETPLVRVTMATADLQRAADCPVPLL